MLFTDRVFRLRYNFTPHTTVCKHTEVYKLHCYNFVHLNIPPPK